jgi:phosphatidylinositol kinase/protein kinase (PI-3  family)
MRAEYESLVDRVLRNDNFVMVEHEKEVSFAMAQRGKAGGNNETRRVRERMNPDALKKAWEAKGISTPEDWGEWMRRFSVELLRQSPSPSLRGCFALAQAYPPLARELFNAAFVSCWSMLDVPSKNKSLVEALKVRCSFLLFVCILCLLTFSCLHSTLLFARAQDRVRGARDPGGDRAAAA